MRTVDGHTTGLSASQRAALESDGYIVVRGLLGEEDLQPIRDALSAVVDATAREWTEAGELSDPGEGLPFETRWAALRAQVPAARPVTWRRVLVCPAVYRLWRHPGLSAMARSWLGDELWAHDVWNGRPREPGAEVQRIGWHQDAHYYPEWRHEDGRLLTCWIPLVHVDARAGGLRVLPGSQRRGLLAPETDRYGLRTIPDAALDGLVAEDLETAPGDVVLFTDLTVHQALPNRADYVRWTVDIRFAPATEAVMRKSPGGYRCAAADPSAIEDFDTWAHRYDPDGGVLSERLRSIDELSRSMGETGRELRMW